MNEIEMEVIEGIIQEGEILYHDNHTDEITVEYIIVKYGDEVYQVVKHDGQIVNFFCMRY